MYIQDLLEIPYEKRKYIYIVKDEMERKAMLLDFLPISTPCGPNQRIPYLFSFGLAKCFTQNFIHHQNLCRAFLFLFILERGKIRYNGDNQ